MFIVPFGMPRLISGINSLLLSVSLVPVSPSLAHLFLHLSHHLPLFVITLIIHNFFSLYFILETYLFHKSFPL